MSKFIYRPSYNDVDYCLDVAKYRDSVMREIGATTGKVTGDAILRHFTGACGELAVSRIFGIEWDGAKLTASELKEWCNTKPDLGFFDVKTIGYKKGCLILGNNDKDWATAILVYAPGARDVGLVALTGKGRRLNLQPMRLLGHLPVREAKKISEVQERKMPDGRIKTTYVVKQNLLRPISELDKVVTKFDALRKTQPNVKIHGTSFRLTKWVM